MNGPVTGTDSGPARDVLPSARAGRPGAPSPALTSRRARVLSAAARSVTAVSGVLLLILGLLAARALGGSG